MWNGGSNDLQRAILAAALGHRLQTQSQHQTVRPEDLAHDAVARTTGIFTGFTGISGPLVIMSVPGVGLVGTGVPGHMMLDSHSSSSLGRAVHTAMQAMVAAVEAQMEEHSDGNLQRPPPASESMRDALPRVVVTKEDQLDSSNCKCAVCLEDSKIGAKATRMLCGHLFCTGCIREWLRMANSCPVCRFELATDIQEFEPGRVVRMRDRKVVLKSGDLNMMRMADLKTLMRALGVPGEGCLERQDFIQRLRAESNLEITQDRKDVFYDANDLDVLEIGLLRNLMERHRMPKLPDQLTEKEEREESLRWFQSAGWLVLENIHDDPRKRESIARHADVLLLPECRSLSPT